MQSVTPYSELESAITRGDVGGARAVLSRDATFLKEGRNARDLLAHAAGLDNVEMVSLLVEHGANVNEGASDDKPEGVILEASREGAVNVVRWLLKNGAMVNHVVEGERRCWALQGATRKGRLDVVKLLVEEGSADVNATWGNKNALSFAVMYGKNEIESYLRSKGAVEPGTIVADVAGANPVFQHIERHIGKPKPLSLQEVAAGEPSITVYAVPMEGKLALVTSGMSERPMTVPRGCESYRFAELVMYLPANWPLSPDAINDPNHFWPIEWIRQIARYPHENDTWLGGPTAVIANGDPPEPLAPNTRLTCLLVIAEPGEFGRLKLADGRQIVFYTVFPLYTEERDLEKLKGTPHLLRLFQKHGIGRTVHVQRASVAL